MKQLHIRLSLIQLFLLVLNLIIFSSALPFLTWFVENAFGWIGILATTPFLLIIGRIMPQLKNRELSEYKAIGMIQDYLHLMYQAIQQNTQEVTKILIRLFHLLQKNGRKSHRYEKKTVVDIMGVIYEYSGFRKQKKSA